MKIRRIVCLLLALLTASALLVFSASADEGGSAASASVFSESFDVIAAAGTYIGDVPAMHGNQQTRLVNVSSGTYLGVLTKDNILDHKEGPAGPSYEMSLIHISPDGQTTELLYTEMVYGTSTTVTIMADKDEDIWLYSGWANDMGSIDFNVWHYDVSEKTIDKYLGRKKPKGNNFGYSIALMDADLGKIYGIMSTGASSGYGYFTWCAFDIETKEWGTAYSFKEDHHFAYEYGYPDNNGGFYVVCERYGANYDFMSNIPDLRVSEAMTKFRSRNENANFMWDEGHLIHVLSADGADYENFVIEPAVYDVEKGVYPCWLNSCCDLIEPRGTDYAFVLGAPEDNGAVGSFNTLYVYDKANGYEKIASAAAPSIYGSMYHLHRFFQDAEGNIYLMIVTEDSGAYMEFWRVTFENGEISFRLVTDEKIPGSLANKKSISVFFNNTSRANSVPSDICYMIIASGGTYHYVTADFSVIRNRAK